MISGQHRDRFGSIKRASTPYPYYDAGLTARQALSCLDDESRAGVRFDLVEHIAANSCLREEGEDKVEKSSRPNPRIRNYEHPVAAKRTHMFRERTHHTKAKVNVRRDGEEIKALICAPRGHG